VRRPAEAGDFARVYDDEVWHVYGFFGYRVASREQAEDLTQLTFERALAAWDRFDPERASVRTWLMAIAHNLLVDHYRADATATHEPLPEGDAEQAALGTQQPPEGDLGLSPELESALAELGARERELIALRFGADMTGLEIAELTGLSLSNVHQILSRSMRRLRDKLREPVSR
jgi:RNA polymerase sigma-70 factor, ECF subfamily